ncbi:hypothetical protein C0993_007052 [Termitomyces sp. T159_Od127]|nr:hypothetical protein C0993_007052 [Termitomyces sp. T159_Od127]
MNVDPLSCASSPMSDDLDSVLRTSLWPHDPGFRELTDRRFAWWDSKRIRSWLLGKGYTLYRPCPSEAEFFEQMYPSNPGPHESVFPYANLDDPEPDDEFFPNLYGSTSPWGNVVLAQDTQGQHVAIKAVLDGSEEYRILKFLHDQGLPRSIDDFHNVIPVLEVLPCEGDTMQGEFDFNPFAFDVGMLGVMFCREFQHLTHTVPMLAPLFDRMTTRDIIRRFKASEALQFFEEQVVPLTPERVLSFGAESNHRYVTYDYYDRWKHLDPDFVEKWAAYREPPVPYHIRFLRKICSCPWGFRIVSSIRRLGRFLSLGWTILGHKFLE